MSSPKDTTPDAARARFGIIDGDEIGRLRAIDVYAAASRAL